MPVVLRVGPYRFVIYGDEPDEPPHVHVKRDRSEAKFWLSPVRLAHATGYRATELRKIARLIEAHRDPLIDAWNNRPRPGDRA